MPAKIRLKRVGRRGQPAYRVVVVDESKSRSSQVLEELGHYNPIEDQFQIDTAHALDWLQKGAQPTATTRSLLSKMGVMAQWHARRGGAPVAEGTTPTTPAQPDPAPADADEAAEPDAASAGE
jgi:small subunit ribosomal protein S16